MENIVVQANVLVVIDGSGNPIPGYPEAQSSGSFIYWNTANWIEQTIDLTIPSDYGITGMIPWAQFLGATDRGVGRFGCI